MNKIYVLLFIVLNIYSINAQSILQPEEAVAFALEKNFDIIIAKNDAEVQNIYNNKATAGMLPKINITTGDVFNLNNINQRFASGEEIKNNWIPVNNFNAALNLNWTIFDGLKMFATKDRLNALASLGELQLKNQIQNTIANVLKAYFDIVQQKQNIKALYESLKISEERISLSDKKFNVGYADKTPLLQAKVDFNNQKINILKQETNLQQQKITLNNLIGRDNSIDFDVINDIDINKNFVLQNILDTFSINNLNLQMLNKDIEIAKYQHKEIKSQRLPLINLNTGYNYAQNNSKAGFQIFNRTYGPTIGVNATIPIFTGGVVKKQLEASSVNIATKQISFEQTKHNLNAQIIAAYNNFNYALSVLELNEKNIADAKENLDITLEKYRLNQANSVEIRQAQSSYEDALFNVIEARYTSKIAEIDLKKISNTLVDENKK